MIATCRFIRSRELADHQRGRFADFEEEYPLTPERDYVVLGIGVWETLLVVLVKDDGGDPCWCPAGLFALDRQQVPPDWLCSLGDGIAASGRDLWTRWVFKCGYPELVADERHSDLLMERDPVALAIFEQEVRRREDMSGAGDASY